MSEYFTCNTYDNDCRYSITKQYRTKMMHPLDSLQTECWYRLTLNNSWHLYVQLHSKSPLASFWYRLLSCTYSKQPNTTFEPWDKTRRRHRDNQMFGSFVILPRWQHNLLDTSLSHLYIRNIAIASGRTATDNMQTWPLALIILTKTFHNIILKPLDDVITTPRH